MASVCLLALSIVKFQFSPLFNRVESTDSLRVRIRELETECKKLSMDMKLKEEQIRDLEGKCQVSLNITTTFHLSLPYT